MDPRQKKTVSLLLGIIAVLLAAILIVLGVKSRKGREEAAVVPPKTQSVITQQHAYTALSYHNGSTALAFTLNEEGTWVWTEDADFPLDETAVPAIVDLLTALKPQQTIAQPEALESYALDQPAVTLTATAEDGSALHLAFGKTTTDGNSYYMLMNGEEQPVYIVDGALVKRLQTPIYDMCVPPALPALSEETVNTVTVTAGETETSFTAVRPKAAEEEASPAPAAWTSGGKDVTDSGTVAALLDMLKAPAFEKCVDYRPSEEAASICGFDAPTAVLSVIYRTEAGGLEELALSIGTKAYEADGYYARWNDDPSIYLLSAALAQPVLAAAENGL